MGHSTLLALALMVSTQAGGPVEAPADAIDRLVLREMERQRIPGVTIAVVRDGKPVKVKGYGFANLEQSTPADQETVYQTGSIGKQFTATAVMILVERGVLDLDTPVRKYLESIPEAYGGVTVRHLLTHTGGLPELHEGMNLRSDYSDDELLSRAFSGKPVSEPGAVFSYSNAGYVVLGILISRMSGQFYGDLLRQEVFEPLGMKSARLISEADIVPHRAAGYRLQDALIKNQEWVSPSLNRTADGSLYMTISDLIAWDAALRDQKVLTPAMLETMWTPARTADGKSTGYGFGWSIGEVQGHRRIQHGGAWQGFTAWIERYRDTGLTIVVLTNLEGARPHLIAAGIAGLCDPSLEHGVKHPDSPSATPDVQPRDVTLEPLFPADGPVASGWLVRDWADVSRPPAHPATWQVADGVLHGTGGEVDDRWIGTWLLSEAEYGDFVLDFEFYLGGAGGNGGLALRAPLHGDPAFDGMEFQLADTRYQLGLFPAATPAQLTGGIYLAAAPRVLAYRPEDWNHVRVELVGSSLRAWLNGELIHDRDLDNEHTAVRRHEGSEPVFPLAQRARRGHIGFQDLSDSGNHLQVRNARIARIE